MTHTLPHLFLDRKLRNGSSVSSLSIIVTALRAHEENEWILSLELNFTKGVCA